MQSCTSGPAVLPHLRLRAQISPPHHIAAGDAAQSVRSFFTTRFSSSAFNSSPPVHCDGHMNFRLHQRWSSSSGLVCQFARYHHTGKGFRFCEPVRHPLSGVSNPRICKPRQRSYIGPYVLPSSAGRVWRSVRQRRSRLLIKYAGVVCGHQCSSSRIPAPYFVPAGSIGKTGEEETERGPILQDKEELRCCLCSAPQNMARRANWVPRISPRQQLLWPPARWGSQSARSSSSSRCSVAGTYLVRPARPAATHQPPSEPGAGSHHIDVREDGSSSGNARQSRAAGGGLVLLQHLHRANRTTLAVAVYLAGKQPVRTALSPLSLSIRPSAGVRTRRAFQPGQPFLFMARPQR